MPNHTPYPTRPEPVQMYPFQCEDSKPAFMCAVCVLTPNRELPVDIISVISQKTAIDLSINAKPTHVLDLCVCMFV